MEFRGRMVKQRIELRQSLPEPVARNIAEGCAARVRVLTGKSAIHLLNVLGERDPEQFEL
jgi:hypothetical protein